MNSICSAAGRTRPSIRIATPLTMGIGRSTGMSIRFPDCGFRAGRRWRAGMSRACPRRAPPSSCPRGSAAATRDLPQGASWDRQCCAWLAQEMDVQVLPDGADFESSVPYHRLVTELFLGAARLGDDHGRPLPDTMLARVRAMVDFLGAVVRPDGLMPQVGDADDGRVHILSGYGTWYPQDPRHLFGPAGCPFYTRERMALADDRTVWESVWWGFDPPAIPPRPATVKNGVRHFAHAGLTVGREGR